MSYYGSSQPGNVSNFNAINSPTVTSTGTITLTGDLAVTGTLTVTGNYKLTDAVSGIAGTTDLAATADLANTGFESVTSTSGALKKYLLTAPAAGAQKRIYNATPDTTGATYVYASASSAYTAYFGANTSQNVLQFAQAGKVYVDLLGISTAQWHVMAITTLNCATTGTCVISSSNT